MPADESASRHDPEAALLEPPSWPVQEDLHLHTNASDGVKTPSEIVELVNSSSLRLFAITDHDTTSGLDEAEAVSARYPDITFIPGIELSAQVDDSEIHLTCHFIDRDNQDLQIELALLEEDRASKAEQIIERLRTIGLPVSWEEVVQNADGSIGRPHIARAMMARGYVASVADAFKHYLTPGKPAYVSRRKLHAIRAIELVDAAGGVATIAHPRTVSNVEDALDLLVPHGLAGIEVYAEKYGSEMIQYFSDLADHHGLVKSGGSDYHANNTVNEILPGMNGPPPGTVRNLYRRAVARHGISGIGYRLDESKL